MLSTADFFGTDDGINFFSVLAEFFGRSDVRTDFRIIRRDFFTLGTKRTWKLLCVLEITLFHFH